MSRKTKNNLYPIFHRDGKLFIIDDVIEIPEEIKNMTEEEMDREIARLEAEGRKERDRIRKERG